VCRISYTALLESVDHERTGSRMECLVKTIKGIRSMGTDRAFILLMAILVMLPISGLLPFSGLLTLQPVSAGEMQVRVALALSAGRATVGGYGEGVVLNLETGAEVVRFAGENGVTFEATAGGMVRVAHGLTGEPVGAFSGPLVVRAVESSQHLNFGSRHYRGILYVHSSNGGVTVVNILPVEEYLRGVVPREMPSSWPIEALKAQAVAARTYALRQVISKAGLGLYDVVATTDSQVYGGVEGESLPSDRAVLETAGEVMRHSGQLISAVFHSTSGGHTENSEDVWSYRHSYLRGVEDYDQQSPHYRWVKTLELSQIEEKLLSTGLVVGKLLGIRPGTASSTTGRLKTVILVGSDTTLEVDASTFRFALGLKSTWFDISFMGEASGSYVKNSLDPEEDVFVVGADGEVNEWKVGKPYAIAANEWLNKPFAYTVMGYAPLSAGVDFLGRGWGHGVGMSQWGARGMAEEGYSYKDILRYYYRGIEITSP